MKSISKAHAKDRCEALKYVPRPLSASTTYQMLLLHFTKVFIITPLASQLPISYERKGTSPLVITVHASLSQ